MPGFVKDMTTGSLLNTDNNALASYKRQKKALYEASRVNERMDAMETDVSEMKAMLQAILGKLT